MTYEPQVNSDVFAMFQSEVEGRIVAWSLLIKDVPAEHHHDLDLHRRACSTGTRTSIPSSPQSNRVFPEAGAAVRGDRGRTVIASSGSATARGYYSAKELTVLPKRTVTIRDAAAYGLILTQGHGTFGTHAGLDAVDDPLRRR